MVCFHLGSIYPAHTSYTVSPVSMLGDCGFRGACHLQNKLGYLKDSQGEESQNWGTRCLSDLRDKINERRKPGKDILLVGGKIAYDLAQTQAHLLQEGRQQRAGLDVQEMPQSVLKPGGGQISEEENPATFPRWLWCFRNTVGRGMLCHDVCVRDDGSDRSKSLFQVESLEYCVVVVLLKP